MNEIKSFAAAALALPLALSLGACATTSEPQVAAFDRSAEFGGVPRGTLTLDGESFVEGRAASALPYNRAVESRLLTLGYSRAGGGAAQFVAEVDVRQAQRSGPSGTSIGVGGGSYGGDVGIGGGISFPIGKKVMTLTEMEVRIVRQSDGLAVWEGRAQKETRGEPDANLLADELARALFTEFPAP